MKRKWKKAVGLLFAVIVIGALALSGILFTYAKTKPSDEKICQGVYVGDVNISGMTKEQAYEAVNEYVNKLVNRKITIDVEGEKVKTSLKKLGFACEENDYIEEAYQLGKVGNVIKRFKEMQDVERQNVVYELRFEMEEEKVRQFVEEECGKYNVEAKNAALRRENGTFIVTEDRTGKHVEVEETVGLILDEAFQTKEVKNITIQAPVKVDVPQFTTDQMKLCNMKMGTFNTNVGGSADRVFNVKHATDFINGTVVYPGEEFSVANAIYPLTSANGYKEAPSYLEGQVVDSLGGGVCQVSTTLYNALLRAEMEIVERHPHSMIVTYVSPAMDAAIAGDYKDLKFKNNTDAPVYLEGFMSGSVLYFNVYGHETRDTANRKITFESEVLERIEPGNDVVKRDSSHPESYFRVDQSAHIGYKANLWKIVTVNGEEESKEKVNYSSYKASPRYVTVGTKKVAKKNDKDDDDSKETSKPKETKKPTNTKEPTQTQKPKAVTTPEPTQAPVEEVPANVTE